MASVIVVCVSFVCFLVRFELSNRVQPREVADELIAHIQSGVVVDRYHLPFGVEFGGDFGDARASYMNGLADLMGELFGMGAAGRSEYCAALERSGDFVRVAMLEQLRTCPPEDVVDVSRRVAEVPLRACERTLVLRAIVSTRARPDIGAVLHLMRSADEEGRRTAVAALRLSIDPDSRRALEYLRDFDASESVRVAAKEALN